MIAVIADIHGNYPALRAVMQAIEAAGVSTVYSLGDVAGYYSSINECVDLLRSKGVTHLYGNHEDYLLTGSRCERLEEANVCIDYQRSVITAENMEWLRCAPRRVDFDAVSMVHGGWHDNLDEYMLDIPNDYFDNIEAKFFFSGHTHRQKKVELKCGYYYNPGSVGQPRDGDPRSAFALFDGSKVFLERVAYDIDETAAAMAECGFGNQYFDNLYSGSRIGTPKGRGFDKDGER